MATEPGKRFLFAADMLTFRRWPWTENTHSPGYELRDHLLEKYDKSEPAVFLNYHAELMVTTLEELCDDFYNYVSYGAQSEFDSALSPMITKLDEVVQDKNMDTFTFVFITDGRFTETHDQLLHKVKNSVFISRITNIQFFMFGFGMPVDRYVQNMLSIFQGIPAEVIINNTLSLKKEVLWKEGDDIISALKNLEQRLDGVSDVSTEIKVPVRENLDEIEKYYSGQMLRKICLEHGATEESLTDVLRKLLHSKDIQKVTQLTAALARAQISDPIYMKIQKLYRKLSKGCGEAYHPVYFRACRMSLKCLCDYVGFSPPEQPKPDDEIEQEPAVPEVEDIGEQVQENLEVADKPVEENMAQTANTGEIEQEPAVPEVEDIGEQVQENLEVADKPLEENMAQTANTEGTVNCGEKSANEDAESKAITTATEAHLNNDGTHTQRADEETSAEKVDLPTIDKETIEENDGLPKVPCVSEEKAAGPEAALNSDNSGDNINPEEESEEERQYRRSDTVDEDLPGTSTDAGQGAIEEEPKNEDNNEDNLENNDEENENEEEIKKPSEMFEKAKYWNSEDDQYLLNTPGDPQRLCAVFQIESKVHVIQMQPISVWKLVFSDYRNLWLQRHILQEYPFRIFDLIDRKNLENLILSDHVSAESYAHTLYSMDDSYDDEFLLFKSTCTVKVYPIFVYNFGGEISDLYAEKTVFDEYLVENLCGILLQQFFSMRSILGSKPLWAIVFLYMIYNTKRIQGNSFLKECVRNTILRISIVFECDLSLVPDKYPKLKVPIIDAFTYIAETSPEYCSSSEGCIFCRIGSNSIFFINMLQNIFQLQPPKVKCWALRTSLDYLNGVYTNNEAKRFLETIVRTKVQDWIDTVDGPLLLGAKTNEQVYNDSLKMTNASVLLRIMKCLKTQRIPKDLKCFMDQLVNDSNETLYSEDLSYDLNLLDHIKICRSTCRPISVCPATKMAWRRCLSSDANRSEFSFFNIYGKFCRKFKSYPYVDDLLSFLVKQYPNKMFYNNTEKVLLIVTQKFKALNIDVTEFNERFKDSYSPAKRLEIERTCSCPAHECA